MPDPRDWRAWVRAQLGPLRIRPERENEIIDELALQLETAYEQARRQGQDDDQSRQQAAAEVPDWRALAAELERIEARPEDRGLSTASGTARRAHVMTDTLQDLQQAARALVRTPTYGAATTLTLALGLALATVALSLVDTILLRPLPFASADRLVIVKATVPPEGTQTAEITYPDALDLSTLGVFDRTAAMVPLSATVTFADPPSQIEGFEVSPGLFDLLGVSASVGRLLSVADEAATGPPVVVIGHGYWQRLGAPANIVGQTLLVNGLPRTIVGIAPPGFRVELLPHPGDVFVPLTTANFGAGNRALRAFRVVGRLRDGVSMEEASAAATTLGAQLALSYPNTNRGRSFSVHPLQDEIVGPVRSQLWIVMGLVALVFLVAVVNVAGLVTARTVARMRDVAVHLALGAGWWRLLRRFLAEGLLISAGAALLGGLLAWVGIEALGRTQGLTLPRLGEVRIDSRIIAALSAMSAIVALSVGVLPLMVARRLRDTSTLRTGHETAGRPAMRIRVALMTGQTAFVFLLVLTAVLLATSLRTLLAQPLGFDTVNVVTMRVAVPPSRYPTLQTTMAFYTGLLDAVRAHPTVQGAGIISNLPLAGNTGSTLTIQGREDVSLAMRPTVGWHWTSPGYFTAMGMPILKGRDFTAHDVTRSPHVTVINETLARLHFGGEDPIGKRVYFGGFGPAGPPEWHEVIGVVGDVRHRALESDPDARAYDLLGQHWGRTISLAVRTDAGVFNTAGLVRRLVADHDPQLAVFAVRTTAELVEGAVSTRRLLLRLVTTFAGIGLVVAVIGLYGTMSYMVLQRTREMGVRIALGAAPLQVYRLVLARGVQIVAVGVGLGLLFTVLTRRLIDMQLFGVTAMHVPSLAMATAALLGSVVFACLGPARRAVRVSPVDALRAE